MTCIIERKDILHSLNSQKKKLFEVLKKQKKSDLFFKYVFILHT